MAIRLRDERPRKSNSIVSGEQGSPLVNSVQTDLCLTYPATQFGTVGSSPEDKLTGEPS